MSNLTTNLISLQPAFFETQVLGSFLCSQSFFKAYGSRIQAYSESLNGQKKFSSYINNVIFDIIAEFRDSDRGDELADAAIPRTWVEDMIAQMGAAGEIMPDVQERIPTELDRIYDRASSEMVACTKGDVFETWFESTMVDDYVTSLQRTDASMNAEEAKSRMESLLHTRSSSAPAVSTMSQAIQMPSHIDLDLAVSSLAGLNTKIGGGFGRGESTIVAAMTGGGKTVLATQLAMNFALNMKKVTLVTTEQKPYELTPRMLSSHMQVPFSEFRRGGGSSVIPGTVLRNARHAEAAASLVANMDENLRFLDWADGNGKTVETELEAELDSIGSNIEDPFETQILIFDWIGGALARNSRKDLREIYLNAATCLHELAKKKNIAVIMFAQLNKFQAKNKVVCTSDMLAECKSMADNATNAIYISGLRSDENDLDSTYKEIQTMNIDKSRKGPGGKINIVRDFKYQRFLELAGVTRNRHSLEEQ
jgi:replicative DNA helicase